MRILSVGAVVLVACSNKVPPKDAAANCADACADRNPNGDCYPAGPYGTTARDKGVSGDRIQNFSFQGYPNVSTMKTVSGALQTVELADFYDPKATKYRLIWLITSAGWCTACIQETQFLAMPGGLAETMLAQGVVFVQALMEGFAAGTASVQSDLDDWIMKLSPNFTQVLDPSAANLGAFSTADAVPFSIAVDARSMEIVFRDKGFNSGAELQGNVRTWLTWTMNNPPLAESCP